MNCTALKITGLLLLAGLFPAIASASSILPTYENDAAVPVDNNRFLVDRYAFTFKAENVRISLSVNGVPLFFRSLTAAGEMDVTFNEWLRQEENSLEVRLEHLDSQKKFDVGYDIYYQSPSQIVTSTRTIVFSNPKELSLPLRQTIKITAPSAPGMLVWAGQEVKLDELTRQTILDRANKLRSDILRAFEQSNYSFLSSYDRMILDDLAKAYGRPALSEKDIEMRRNEISGQLQNFLTKPIISTPELKAQDIEMTLMGDRTLIRLVRKNQTPLIEVKQGDFKITIDKPFFAVIAGVPTWVR